MITKQSSKYILTTDFIWQDGGGKVKIEWEAKHNGNRTRPPSPTRLAPPRQESTVNSNQAVASGADKTDNSLHVLLLKVKPEMF